MSRPSGGFTLIELLVAMAIFAVISMMAYSGLTSVLTTEKMLAERGEQLRGLQGALSIIQRDIVQTVDRGVRDEFGAALPSVQVSLAHTELIEFTRAGYRNPMAEVRSSLQRIAYVLQEDRLIRRSWPHLDRMTGTEPYEAELLSGVQSVQVRLMDERGRWKEHWPIEERGIELAGGLPKAVEVVIELKNLGKVRRLFPLVEQVSE